ncbi:UDP-N-acetylmuramate--L-alanine ligase [Paeniglutamicibacter sulfureus]|uniref:UDP-N-acetylmuramate--L-alanine ligase n=1 Tax=Paeniglutamicibacter sulfureus TaxID=43666 RepID=UPI0026669C5E|nr:UDP-N-acetylmuramate--L-alanine ligase [Paeniglutamicibacter sulfureus]MDO2932718.1 UDP-N-acetylmuramate--L-alanine ligase [Paeniglutamicibacter sulfureus]
MQEQNTLATLGNVHLLGIGGVGVSAVARLMLARGLTVSGTDAKDLPVLDDLREAGARINVGYAASNLGDADTVVVSSIIKDGNPEYDEAVARGLRILHRSEGLAATMEGHRVITVAGTHGKTTTTSLVAFMLREAGISPTFAIGANIASLGVNAEYGQGRVFVAEADESDASFLNYAPDVAVVTNIEADHLDHYGSVEAVHRAFYDFACLLPDSGLLICCADDPGSLALAVRMRRERPELRVQTYGFAEVADRRLSDAKPVGLRFACTLEWGSGETAALELAVPGNHNLLNAAAAFAVGLDCGLEPEAAVAGLGAFTGAARRFDFRGEAGGVRVFDDYAHHPTEVTAALRAARAVAGDGAVHVLFQPHLFSRTKEFHREFAEALSLADSAYVLEIYPARETPIPGVTSELLTRELNTAGRLVSMAEAAEVLASVAAPGDVVMTIGAGDVTEQAGAIVAALEKRLGS